MTIARGEGLDSPGAIRPWNRPEKPNDVSCRGLWLYIQPNNEVTLKGYKPGGADVFDQMVLGLALDGAELVGGKNASLGELYKELAVLGVRIPDGFATTAAASST